METKRPLPQGAAFFCIKHKACLVGEAGDAVHGTGCASVRRQSRLLQHLRPVPVLVQQATRWMAPTAPVFVGKAGSYKHLRPISV